MNQHVKVRESCVEIGRLAWQVLSGNWVKAVLASVVFVLSGLLILLVLAIACFIISIPFYGNDLVKSILVIISLIVFILAAFPLTLGYYSFFLAICRGEDASPIMVVKGFRNAGRAIGTGFLISIINFIAFLAGCLLLWYVLSGIFGAAAAPVDTLDPYSAIKAFTAFWIALLLLSAIDFFVSQVFFMAYFVIANSPHVGCFEAIGECISLMKGNLLKKVVLYLYLFLITAAFQLPELLVSFIPFGEFLLIIIFPVKIVAYIAWTFYFMACETVFYEIASGHLGAAENSWKPVELQPQGSMAYGNQQYAGESWRQEESEPVGETMGSINFNFNIDDSRSEPLLSEQQKSNINNIMDTNNRDISGSVGLEQKIAQKPADILGLDRANSERAAVEVNPVRNLNQTGPAENLNQTAVFVDEKSNMNEAEKNAAEKKTVMAENVREDEAVTRTRKIIREMIESGDSSLDSFIRRWEEQNRGVLH